MNPQYLPFARPHIQRLEDPKGALRLQALADSIGSQHEADRTNRIRETCVTRRLSSLIATFVPQLLLHYLLEIVANHKFSQRLSTPDSSSYDNPST